MNYEQGYDEGYADGLEDKANGNEYDLGEHQWELPGLDDEGYQHHCGYLDGYTAGYAETVNPGDDNEQDLWL